MDKTRPKGPANENHQGRVKPNRRMNEAPRVKGGSPTPPTKPSSVQCFPLPCLTQGSILCQTGVRRANFPSGRWGRGLAVLDQNPAQEKNSKRQELTSLRTHELGGACGIETP